MRRTKTDFSNVPCRGMTFADVAKCYGAAAIATKLEDAGELAPFYRNKSFKLYDVTDVMRAWDRFRAGKTSIQLIADK